MNAPSHGRKISTSAQPTLAQPLRVRSLNMSKTQRNQMKMAVIQTKIQNVHRTMSQKFPEKSMVTPFQVMVVVSVTAPARPDITCSRLSVGRSARGHGTAGRPSGTSGGRSHRPRLTVTGHAVSPDLGEGTFRRALLVLGDDDLDTRISKGAPGRIRTCAPASGGRCSIP